ncbi:hypothetical protein NDU88_005427 [Pleurodeles waltl]|uniref:Uncharacterized protein n=1 Tax=Pleurodeles waltl TaxID=8319 RepID=A0AAV7WAE6_PLEWA|nr:hypothetical protein NDU88_005427 [Pleurodeles waltl]
MAPSALRGCPRSSRAPASPSGSPILVRVPASGGDGASGLLERARHLRPGSQPPGRPQSRQQQLGGPGSGSHHAPETPSPLACYYGPTGPFAEGEARHSACL